MSEEKWEEMSVSAGRTNYFYSSEAVKWAADAIESLQAELAVCREAIDEHNTTHHASAEAAFMGGIGHKIGCPGEHRITLPPTQNPTQEETP